tara:strand:+ start:1880 stop:2338 length:459 start_codon:yes stop_codon:yes gene_type:complete
VPVDVRHLRLSAHIQDQLQVTFDSQTGSMGQEPDKSHAPNSTGIPVLWLGKPMTKVTFVGHMEKSVQTFAKLFTRFEIGHFFLANRDCVAGARIAPNACVAMLDGKGTKTAKLDPVSAGKCVGDFIKDRRNNPFDISLIQMRVHFSKAGNQF